METAIAKLNGVGKVAKNAWCMVGITLLLFCLIEGSVQLFFLVRERLPDSESDVDRVVTADTYSNSSWVRSYWDEHMRTTIGWSPYVYWRREPFHGKYVNIDDNGIRRTTAPEPVPTEANRSKIKIAMFGGSTLWGTGVRDPFTIPSVLVKDLRKEGVTAEINNFGESGYVSTHGAITLLLQLQQGHIPDLVVFYDGANDTYSAYQQRVAGMPQNEYNRAKEFNLSKPENFKQRMKVVLQAEAQRLSSARFLNALLRRSGIWSQFSSTVSASPLDNPASKSENLASGVVRTYMGSIDLVKALSEHYQFQYLFYWQPTIFEKINLTKYENIQRREMQAAEPFFQETYELMRQSRLGEKSGRHFHDLSLIFSELREPVFLDFCHIGEAGNDIIAKRMANDIRELIKPQNGIAKRPSSST